MTKSATYIANHIRQVLIDGASAPHTEEVQHFFKNEIKSRGWYTGELRKVAVRFRRTILAENGSAFLVEVADQLFRGDVLEEKVFAVLMLEGLVSEFGKPEFKLFESWLDRVSSWADHDAAVNYLIGPDDSGRPQIATTASALGKVEAPLAPAGGGGKPDPQHTPAQAFRAHSAGHGNAAGQR